MENASNALIMAASVLIAVMVISFGTYLFTSFGNASKQINQTIELKNMDEFNEQFLKYETNQNEYTTYRNCYDIVSIINLARNNNEKIYKDDDMPKDEERKNDNNLYIYIDGIFDIHENSSVNDLNKFINDNNSTETKTVTNKNKEKEKIIVYKNIYKCIVNISPVTGYVKSIQFNAVNEIEKNQIYK